ncbi:hypothetical protein FGB62_64g028 [Gracilaria domingensis]|nr:hypothetical protein FGB62_64g028 [Gracilaria domingensis]
MDPRDEAIINLLEGDNSLPEVETEYGPEGPPAEAYGDSGLGRPKKWSKRSEAARKRWADPSYRAKMLEKRAAKRRMNEEANGGPKQKVEIGRMDSITLCDDDRAKAINDYARSNKLRSEKISAFHRNRKLWMETRLSTGRPKLTDEEYVQMKKAQQEKRRDIALRRVRNSRAKKTNADFSSHETDSET